MISRLMPFKGIEESINLFLKKQICNEWELHIAGDGPMRSLVENACTSNSNIFYHGYVIDDAKEKLFNECDVLLFLTSELETFGLVIIEAYQHGMPVIVSDVSAMRKIVRDKETGLILSNVNENTFADAFKYLGKRENYNKMVNNICKMQWDKKYSDMLVKYKNIYKEVVRKNEG